MERISTLEVLEKVFRGKRLSERSKANYRLVFQSLSAFSEYWRENSGVASEWLASLDGFSDRTVELYFSLARSAGRYMFNVWKIDNPFEQVKRPAVRKKKTKVFDS